MSRKKPMVFFKLFFCVGLLLVFSSCHRYTKFSEALSHENKAIEKNGIKNSRREMRKRKREYRRTGHYSGLFKRGTQIYSFQSKVNKSTSYN